MEVWRLPQGRCVDAVKWLSPDLHWNQEQMLVAALWDPDKGSSQLEISALQYREEEVPEEEEEEGKTRAGSVFLESRASWPQRARITALKTVQIPSARALLVHGSEEGALSLLVTERESPSPRASPLVSKGLHRGPVTELDVEASSYETVCVGEDGRINVVTMAQGQLQSKRLAEGHGILSHSAVCWASPVEFVTAGLGSVLRWWDRRSPGGAVSQSPPKWAGADGTGYIHSIDVHPSRKHVCVVGGSGGSVLAWDLRWQQAPVVLAGSLAKGEGQAAQVSESEVWQVKYDLWPLARGRGIDAGKVSPVMMCSEDGVLAVLDGGEALELLAEPSAINCFDMDTETGTDIVCGLEQESILYFKRGS